MKVEDIKVGRMYQIEDGSPSSFACKVLAIVGGRCYYDYVRISDGSPIGEAWVTLENFADWAHQDVTPPTPCCPGDFCDGCGACLQCGGCKCGKGETE